MNRLSDKQDIDLKKLLDKFGIRSEDEWILSLTLFLFLKFYVLIIFFSELYLKIFELDIILYDFIL
jgi:hypothetical protein